MGMSSYVIDVQDKAMEDFARDEISETKLREILEGTGLDRDDVEMWVIQAEELQREYRSAN